jgi:DHA3 family tetracycline resistance protein-like MFS transporter
VPVYLLLSAGSAGLFTLVATLNLVYQATVVGLSPLQLVLVGTMLEAVCFVAEVPTGIVADLYSRRLSVLIGLALLGCGWILEGSVPHFAAVLAAQAVWGTGFTFTSGATEAWIADEVGDDSVVTAVFVRGTKAGQVGTIVGILLAGGLGLIWLRLPIIAGGIGYVLLAVLLAVIMPERPFSAERDRPTMAGQFRAGLQLARRRRIVRTLLLVSVVSGLASEAFDRLWTVHLLRFSALDHADQVLWFTAIGLIGTLLSLLVTAVISRVSPGTLAHAHPTRLMATLACVQVGAAAIFAVTGHFAIALIVLWLRTIAQVVAQPVGTAWMNRQLEPSVRATVLSMESQFNAVGQVVGGPVLGWVGSAVSVRAALLGSAVTLAPVVGLYGRARDESRPSKKTVA